MTTWMRGDGPRAALLSLLLLGLLLGVWHLATVGTAAPAAAPAAGLTPEQIEYLKLMGKDPTAEAGPVARSGFPTLTQMGEVLWQHAQSPFYDNGPNDKGLGLQLAHSLGRVAIGFALAALVAVPLGFVIGMSPLIYRALDPFIQVLKPISPLAWMPLALYTIKDSSTSGIFVIFICSLCTILTGMRISMGIAWLVIVAAEMLVGGTGIGYFVWNEWNNLSLPNVIVAILVIGVVGMALDLVFARLQKAVTYAD
ncbi:MAG: nitrate ABC transporter, permease protein [Ideonella sp.]|nr:nitrate ABC transporter, permease protein [Ideonella sp.]